MSTFDKPIVGPVLTTYSKISCRLQTARHCRVRLFACVNGVSKESRPLIHSISMVDYSKYVRIFYAHLLQETNNIGEVMLAWH